MLIFLCLAHDCGATIAARYLAVRKSILLVFNCSLGNFAIFLTESVLTHSSNLWNLRTVPCGLSDGITWLWFGILYCCKEIICWPWHAPFKDVLIASLAFPLTLNTTLWSKLKYFGSLYFRCFYVPASIYRSTRKTNPSACRKRLNLQKTTAFRSKLFFFSHDAIW